MRFDVKKSGNTLHITDSNSGGNIFSSEIDPNTSISEVIGLLDQDNPSVQILINEMYQWEWINRGSQNHLICTSNDFLFAAHSITDPDESYNKTESYLKVTKHWRHGDKIKPRYNFITRYLMDNEFYRDDSGALFYKGEPASMHDWVTIVSSVNSLFSTMNISIAEFNDLIPIKHKE